MRTMADSDVAASLPEGMDIYAAYIDGQAVPGQPQSYAAAKARFPDKIVLSISVEHPGHPADIGDVENGGLTIKDAIRMGYKTVYCSTSQWLANLTAYKQAGKPQPNWWVAAYPGYGPTVPPGAVAHQYQDVGGYDLSVVADHWPGVDPLPGPPTKEEDVKPFVMGIQGEAGIYLFVPAAAPYKILLPDIPTASAMIVAYGPQQNVSAAFAASIPTFAKV